MDHTAQLAANRIVISTHSQLWRIAGGLLIVIFAALVTLYISVVRGGIAP
jgi:hypothetical protein